MHQDRNNGHWSELKRKKNRLAFYDEMESRSTSNKNNFVKNTSEMIKTKNIRANDLSFNNKHVLDEFVDDGIVGVGQHNLKTKGF